MNKAELLTKSREIESNWLKYNQTKLVFSIDFDSTFLRLKVEDTGKDTDKDTDTVRIYLKEWGEKWGKEWGEKWSEFTENQKAILYELQQDSFITTSHLAKKVGINQRNIKKNLDILKQKQVIIRIGPAKGGRWEIIFKKTKNK